ncbi:unnamed protein product [Closterium sp. NIES-65]|nr:unnamed protein product [Closterium sp. NIES-65]
MIDATVTAGVTALIDPLFHAVALAPVDPVHYPLLQPATHEISAAAARRPSRRAAVRHQIRVARRQIPATRPHTQRSLWRGCGKKGREWRLNAVGEREAEEGHGGTASSYNASATASRDPASSYTASRDPASREPRQQRTSPAENLANTRSQHRN